MKLIYYYDELPYIGQLQYGQQPPQYGQQPPQNGQQPPQYGKPQSHNLDNNNPYNMDSNNPHKMDNNNLHNMDNYLNNTFKVVLILKFKFFLDEMELMIKNLMI